MARASIDVLGDSASAIAALDKVDASVGGLTATLDKAAASAEASSSTITGLWAEQATAAEGLATKVESTTAAMIAASARRVETMKAEASAARELAASYAAGSTEQQAALALAARKTSSANRLLGVETAAARPSITQTAGTIGRGLTTYATVPAAFIGYEAVKQAVDFNQQMLLLKTQAGDATDSIRELSQQVLELARTSPQGPVQLSQGLFHLVSLGLRGSQAIGTLKEAAIGAGEGLASLEDVSSALGAAVVSDIKGAQDYTQALTTLQATAAVGNMRFADFASSVGNILPAAAAAGVSLKEMGAAMAVLTDRGMDAHMAATRLRMTFAQMQAPSAVAMKALADLGINGANLGQMLRQPNGLLHVLELLRSRIAAVGNNRGYADLLAAFGRSRSGLGIETLVQSLDAPVSSYQSKLAAIGVQQQRFAQNQQAYLESPAYKLHSALANVEADMVRLGQSLTPAVTGLADTVSTLANAFTALPGPVKEFAGVAVGVLAVGGPIGLAISGLGRLAEGLRTMFGTLAGPLEESEAQVDASMSAMAERVNMYTGSLDRAIAAERMVGPAMVTSGAEADTALAGARSAAVATNTEVATLRSSLVGLASKAFVVTMILDVIPHSTAGQKDLNKLGLGFLGHIPVLGGAFTQDAKYGHDAGQAFASLFGVSDAQRRAAAEKARRNRYDATHAAFPSYQAWKVMNPHGSRALYESEKQFAYDVAHPHSRQARRDRHHQDHGPQPPPPLTTFQLPQNIATDLAKAQAGYGNLGKADARARDWILRMIHQHRFQGKALEDAYNELATLGNKAVSAVNKSNTAFKKTVDEDTLLAQARLDLANGDLAAERSLLEKDRQRLQALLGEAQNADQRAAVLRQLATVTRMLHTKSDQFAVSARLQEEMARADALAALHPNLAGPTALQLRLAEQEKAAAMKAIDSNTLTLQGMTAAWQVVQQANSVIAQAMSDANTYHAVSTSAIVGSVKGLSQAQRLQLRERLAQAEAHRGYVPDRIGGHHTHHHVDVDVHVKSNDSHIVHVVNKHHRRSQQRAGARR